MKALKNIGLVFMLVPLAVVWVLAAVAVNSDGN